MSCFTALLFGLASGFVDLLLHRLLPAGWAGGLAYGALLLVLAGTRIEPLRRSDPDFDPVGHGWVLVTALALLVVFHGVLVPALAGRFSRAAPLLPPSRARPSLPAPDRDECREAGLRPCWRLRSE